MGSPVTPCTSFSFISPIVSCRSDQFKVRKKRNTKRKRSKAENEVKKSEWNSFGFVVVVDDDVVVVVVVKY